MNTIKKFLLLWGILFFYPNLSLAQNGPVFLNPDDELSGYINYQINSGNYLTPFLTNQPLDLNHFLLRANVQNAAFQYFKKHYSKIYQPGRANFFFTPGDYMKFEKKPENRYKLGIGVSYVSKYVTFYNSTEINQDYKYDKKFAGDLSESDHWLYGRVNDAYVNVLFKNFGLFFGRAKRNWGPINENSLILSNYPYSYDHLLLSYNAGRAKISLIYAQLETLDGYSNMDKDEKIELVEDARKYLVGHRLDINIRKNLQLGFTEMATYGGKDRDFEMAFLNPVNYYYPIQRNDEKQMNGFWAMDVFWKPAPKLTVYSQFLIDDIIVNNEPGQDDRGQYPDRLAASFSLRSGDIFFNGLNLELTFVRVWNRTYQSKFTWENYHYHGRGLGYPCASCEEIKLKTTWWQLFPFVIKNELLVGRYGDVELTDLFLMKKEPFPVGLEKTNVINELKIDCFVNPSTRLFVSIIYRKDPDHYSNQCADHSSYVLNVGAACLFNYSFNFEKEP